MGRCVVVVPLVLLVLAAGCVEGPRLVPAPRAVPVDHLAGAAQATSQGVRFLIRTEAWRGSPQPLDAVIPIHVQIDNRSHHALRIRYRDLTLLGADGLRLQALPPLQIRGVQPIGRNRGWQPLAQNAVPATDADERQGGGDDRDEGERQEQHARHPDGPFFVAAPYGPLFPGDPMWQGPFDYDWDYYWDYYREWPVQLPTRDMIRSALPEGVLGTPGSVSGFVYFSNLPPGEHQATLTMTLVDADTEVPFGTIRIPLVHG